MLRYLYLLFAILILISLASCTLVTRNPLPDNNTELPSDRMIYSMKGVGIDLPQSDFVEMKNAGIEVISTEWGMEQNINEVKNFLDQAQSAGLKVVMDGGFSARAWGFTNDDWESLPQGKRPVWQKEVVQNWVKALKDYPAICAWDICNEFGENLPSGAGIEGSDWPKSMITTEQIKQARKDVLAVDSSRPLHIRTYEWDCDNIPSHIQGLLDNKIADIISLNLYSNYLEKGELQWPEIVKEAGPCCVDIIRKRAPDTIVWISIAAFEDGTMFQRPSPSSLSRDIKYASEISGINGISFFCWGPVNQWDEQNNWYLPKTGSDLWQTIKKEIPQS